MYYIVMVGWRAGLEVVGILYEKRMKKERNTNRIHYYESKQRKYSYLLKEG